MGMFTPICETSQIYYLIGKTPYERRFGQPFKGPIIPFGSLVEYHPITAKDQSKNPSIWKESLTWIVPWNIDGSRDLSDSSTVSLSLLS